MPDFVQLDDTAQADAKIFSPSAPRSRTSSAFYARLQRNCPATPTSPFSESPATPSSSLQDSPVSHDPLLPHSPLPPTTSEVGNGSPTPPPRTRHLRFSDTPPAVASMPRSSTPRPPLTEAARARMADLVRQAKTAEQAAAARAATATPESARRKNKDKHKHKDKHKRKKAKTQSATSTPTRILPPSDALKNVVATPRSHLKNKHVSSSAPGTNTNTNTIPVPSVVRPTPSRVAPPPVFTAAAATSSSSDSESDTSSDSDAPIIESKSKSKAKKKAGKSDTAASPPGPVAKDKDKDKDKTTDDTLALALTFEAPAYTRHANPILELAKIEAARLRAIEHAEFIVDRKKPSKYKTHAEVDAHLEAVYAEVSARAAQEHARREKERREEAQKKQVGQKRKFGEVEDSEESESESEDEVEVGVTIVPFDEASPEDQRTVLAARELQLAKTLSAFIPEVRRGEARDKLAGLARHSSATSPGDVIEMSELAVTLQAAYDMIVNLSVLVTGHAAGISVDAGRSASAGEAQVGMNIINSELLRMAKGRNEELHKPKFEMGELQKLKAEVKELKEEKVKRDERRKKKRSGSEE